MVDVRVKHVEEEKPEQGDWLRRELGRKAPSASVSYTGVDSLPGGRAAIRTSEIHAVTGVITAHMHDGTTYTQDRANGPFRKVDDGDVQDITAVYLKTLSEPSGIRTPGVGGPGQPKDVSTAVAGDTRTAAERALARESAGSTFSPDLPGVRATQRGAHGGLYGRPGVPPVRPGIRPSLAQQGAMRRPGSVGALTPEGPSYSPRSLLEKFKGAESFDGERLFKTFPILFDNTQDPPISLAQAGLSVVAVKTSHDHGKIEAMPEHASFLGRKVVPGVKSGMVSFFVVDRDTARDVERQLERDSTCTVASFDRDGIYVAGHAGGVSMFGPGLEFVELLNHRNVTQRQPKYAELAQKFGTGKPPVIDLSEQGASSESIEMVELPKGKINVGGAFMATFALPPEFGSQKGDVRLWRPICEKFSQVAKDNSCIPIIHDRSFTVMTNVEDPTALETHEDVAMVVDMMRVYLTDLARETGGRTSYDARMYRSAVTCEPVKDTKSTMFRGDWASYQQAMNEPSFDNKVYVDEHCLQFDHRKDPRQRLVATEFEPVRGKNGLSVLSKITPIRNRVAAGQIFEFVGRDTEVETINGVLDKSKSEGLQICLVTGHTGAGKTALVLRAAQEKVGSSNTVVLVFRNKDNLAALTELSNGLLEMLRPVLDANPALATDPDYSKNLALVRGFVKEGGHKDYKYDEEATLDAIVFLFEALSSAFEGTEQKAMLLLDDVDAAGTNMRTVLLKLMSKLKAKAANLKGINIFGTMRSVETHAGVKPADKEYLEKVKDEFGDNKMDVEEFVLHTAADGYAPWLKEFLVKRCLRVSVDNAQAMDDITLSFIAELCSRMASEGGNLHDDITKVSAHSLKLIVDDLLRGGYITIGQAVGQTVDKKVGTISCSRDQYERAMADIRSGKLVCGPEEIYQSQVMRATKDPKKKNMLYLAVILRGLDYRVLQQDKVAEFLGSRLLGSINGAADFKAKLDELRVKMDGSDVSQESAMLSGGAELDMHTLWRLRVEDAMKGDERLVKSIKQMAFRALIAAKRDPAVAQYVDAVMMFDLALASDGGEDTAKDIVFDAIREAISNHDYAKANECAVFAQAQFAGEPAKLCEAYFYLAKAQMYMGNVEEAKLVLGGYVNKNLKLLSPELQIEMVEMYLELFRLEVVARELARDGKGMAIALGNYDKANANMSRYVSRFKVSEGDGSAQDAKYWADVAVQYNKIEALYKRSVRDILGDVSIPLPDPNNLSANVDTKILHAVDLSQVEGANIKDKGFQLAINLCEKLLANLDSRTEGDRKTDIMKAKVSNLLASIILQKNRELVDSDEERLVVKVSENPATAAELLRVVELANRALLIARQRGGLGANYTNEARAASNRFYAANFFDLTLEEFLEFKRVTYEYLVNIGKDDASIHLGNMYCAVIANLFRENLPAALRSEMTSTATSIAKFQHQDEPDSWDRTFNYTESLLLKITESSDEAEIATCLRQSYTALEELPATTSEDYRFLVLLLIARHEVLSTAKGVTTTAAGVQFNYRKLINAHPLAGVQNNEVIRNKKLQVDAGGSVGEKAIFNGNAADSSSITSWGDLVRFGKLPSLRHLITSVQAQAR